MNNVGSFNYSRIVNLGNGKRGIYAEGAFNSSETKPTGDAAADLVSGSIIVEPDTGKVFFYDKPNDEWVEQFSFQG